MKIRYLYLFILIIYSGMLLGCIRQDFVIDPTEESIAIPTVIPLLQPTIPIELDDLPLFLPSACRFVLPDGYQDDRHVTCGDLLVPEQRGDPNTRHIRLAVAIFHPKHGPIEADPVIFLSGGPGVSALEMIRYQFDEVFAPILDNTARDLVIFDQRGVGRSQPALDCPTLDELSLELLDLEIDGRQLNKDHAREKILVAISECRKNLSMFSDLTAYHSPASANDVADLVLALGYERVNLWGGSYGTRLALEVMRSNPAWVRSVVLDAVYPPDVNLYLDAPANYHRALERFFGSCSKNQICSQNYPDLKQMFYTTVDHLNTDPVMVEITDPFTMQDYPAVMDGDALLGLIFQALYDTYFRYRLPQVIYEVANEDFETINQLRGVFVGLLPVASRGMMFSVQCREALFLEQEDIYDGRLQKYPRIAGMYEHASVGRLTYAACRIWDVPPIPVENRLPVYSDMPMLIMSGEFDPITPPAWARHAAESLENVYIYEYPGIGHGASAVDGCPRTMLIEFLKNPTKIPDDTCIQQMRH